ncbi:MAG: hypothetical protein HKM95_06840 [Inquilinus sp.]|nr:hypothetical protein [Inquilinus sp.]
MLRAADPRPGRLSKKVRPGRWLAALSVVVLAACSGNDEADVAERCPRVAIVADAAEAMQFRPGPGRDLTDMTSRAQILTLTGQCAYDDGDVTIAVRMPIVVERGPAFAGGETTYTYFVAVADRDLNVLARESYPVSLEFAGGAGFAAAVEDLEQVIPIAGPADALRYQVLIGFALDRRQLLSNRGN